MEKLPQRIKMGRKRESKSIGNINTLKNVPGTSYVLLLFTSRELQWVKEPTVLHHTTTII